MYRLILQITNTQVDVINLVFVATVIPTDCHDYYTNVYVKLLLLNCAIVRRIYMYK